MSFHLIRIRFLQIKRISSGLGIYNIFLIATYLFAIYSSYVYLQHPTYAYLICILSLLICFGLHFSRPDINFVFKHFEKPLFEIYSEYALLIFPFLFTLLFSSHWYYFFLTYAVLFPISSIKPFSRQQTRMKNLSSYIKPENFEWISGIRKLHIPLIIFYFLAFVSSWIKVVPLFFLWLMTTIFISFYEEGESLIILKCRQEKAHQLLFRKALNHSGYMILLCLPVLVINSAFNRDFLVINVLFLFTQIILLLFCIFFKYTMYEPNAKMGANNIMMGIISIGSLIPFFLPVPLIMAIIYYYKANKNLNRYLHDYDK